MRGAGKGILLGHLWRSSAEYTHSMCNACARQVTLLTVWQPADGGSGGAWQCQTSQRLDLWLHRTADNVPTTMLPHLTYLCSPPVVKPPPRPPSVLPLPSRALQTAVQVAVSVTACADCERPSGLPSEHLQLCADQGQSGWRTTSPFWLCRSFRQPTAADCTGVCAMVARPNTVCRS